MVCVGKKWPNSPIIMGQWKITLNGTQETHIGGTIFPLNHDDGRKGRLLKLSVQGLCVELRGSIRMSGEVFWLAFTCILDTIYYITLL